MTTERLEEIFESDDAKWEGDNAIQGLDIIRSYFPEGVTILRSAGHDVIYSVNIEDIIAAGLTEDDAIKLRKLNWMIEYGALACFV